MQSFWSSAGRLLRLYFMAQHRGSYYCRIATIIHTSFWHYIYQHSLFFFHRQSEDPGVLLVSFRACHDFRHILYTVDFYLCVVHPCLQDKLTCLDEQVHILYVAQKIQYLFKLGTLDIQAVTELWKTVLGCVAALQRKFYLCIPFPEMARPQPQFPDSCVCERFI
jgi:hypothetical protein